MVSTEYLFISFSSLEPFLRSRNLFPIGKNFELTCVIIDFICFYLFHKIIFDIVCQAISRLSSFNAIGEKTRSPKKLTNMKHRLEITPQQWLFFLGYIQIYCLLIFCLQIIPFYFLFHCSIGNLTNYVYCTISLINMSNEPSYKTMLKVSRAYHYTVLFVNIFL